MKLTNIMSKVSFSQKGKSMLRILASTMLVLVWAIAASANVQVGDKLQLALHTTNGMLITTPELKGHLLVVDFWATWCHPCMMEVPHIVKLYKQYAPKGVGFVGVSLDSDIPTMQAVAKQKGIVWPQVCQALAWDSPIAKAWGVNAIPQTFLIGPNGRVLFRGFPESLGSAIRHALKGHPTIEILRTQVTSAIADAQQHVASGNVHQAIAALDGLPTGLPRDRHLYAPARKLAFAFRKAGKAAVKALLADKTAAASMTILLGSRGQLMEDLGAAN
ncbi:MAG: TlpA family protein disulfide reductase [Phycisphaerales bacterium]|nr:TlpA family protein disulfide reductase [Phycisphaerales bacterium]